MAPCKQTAEQFDFEVVETYAKPIDAKIDRIHELAKHLEQQVANVQHGHSESIDELVDDLAQVSKILQTVKQESAVSGSSIQDLYQQVRTLSNKMTSRMGTDDRRLRSMEYSMDSFDTEIRECRQASKGAMRLIEAERSARTEATDGLSRQAEQAAIDLAARFDRIMINYLPAVERKIQAVKQTQDAVAPRVERLCESQDQIWHDAKDLTKRVQSVEDVSFHLSGTVVPRLENRIQEQQELLQIRDAELWDARAAARKAEKQSADLERRMAALEATIQRLSGQATEQPTTTEVKLDFAAELRTAVMRRELQTELTERAHRKHRQNTERLSAETFRGEILRRALVNEIGRRAHRRSVPTVEELQAELTRRRRAETTPRIARRGSRVEEVNIVCKTLMDEISVSVQVPATVAVRYLKQLIYFKTGREMTLVYAGKVLQDDWKVGGGMFTRSASETEEEFSGICDGATVLMVVKKD